MQAGFETLVEAGYDPRNAYFECCLLCTSLNDETSYDITIDGKYIYYLAKNDEQYALKRMTITGENIETLYEKQCTCLLYTSRCV